MNSFNSLEARQNVQAATHYQVRQTSLPRRRMAIASSVTDLKAGGDKAKLTWPIERTSSPTSPEMQLPGPLALQGATLEGGNPNETKRCCHPGPGRIFYAVHCSRGRANNRREGGANLAPPSFARCDVVCHHSNLRTPGLGSRPGLHSTVPPRIC